MRVGVRDVDKWRALLSLDQFPACSALSVHAPAQHGHNELPDVQLYKLLHHRVSLSCVGFAVYHFIRLSEGQVAVDDAQPQLVGRATRQKRKRSVDLRNSSGTTHPFSWADIRLPAVTRFRLDIIGGLRYTGGAAFLTAHTGLLELDINTTLLAVSELTALFHDPAVLPKLTRFTMRERGAKDEKDTDCNLAPLVTALATTVVAASGSPRPIERLHFEVGAERGVFAAAALMPNLTHLQADQVRSGWLEEWTEMHETTGFPRLQHLLLRSKWKRVDNRDATRLVAAHEDLLPFLQLMSKCPLERLDIHSGELIRFSAAAMAQLARYQRLLELSISTWIDGERMCLDWTDATLFAAFTFNCLSHLRKISLRTVRLSAETVVALASASPQLRVFDLHTCELHCHPAVVIAIVGGYCEQIEGISIGDECRDRWKEVQAEDVVVAFRSAVAAAGRSDEYQPFTELRVLIVVICWCTPASVWHALLSLLKHANRVRRVTALPNNDPLVIAALGYLPSIAELGSSCLLPASFATFLEQRSARTGQYRYVASRVVGGKQHSKCPECYGTEPTLDMCSGVVPVEDKRKPVLLRPRSDLFTAYQRSLSDKHQAVLARWAAGDFRAGDGRLSAVESPWERCTYVVIPEPDVDDHRLCAHTHLFYTRYDKEASTTSKEGLAAVDEDDSSESEDDEKNEGR